MPLPGSLSLDLRVRQPLVICSVNLFSQLFSKLFSRLLVSHWSAGSWLRLGLGGRRHAPLPAHQVSPLPPLRSARKAYWDSSYKPGSEGRGIRIQWGMRMQRER